MAQTDLDGDGSNDLLFAGVSNAYRAATLLALDPLEPAGASDESEHPDYQLQGFTKPEETARILLPRTRVSLAFQAYNWATRIRVLDGEIAVSVRERDGINAEHVHHYFNRKLELTRFEFGPYYRALHRQSVARGEIDAPLTPADQERMLRPRVLRNRLSGRGSVEQDDLAQSGGPL